MSRSQSRELERRDNLRAFMTSLVTGVQLSKQESVRQGEALRRILRHYARSPQRLWGLVAGDLRALPKNACVLPDRLEMLNAMVAQAVAEALGAPHLTQTTPYE